MCKDARELIKDQWVRGVDEWGEGKIATVKSDNN